MKLPIAVFAFFGAILLAAGSPSQTSRYKTNEIISGCASCNKAARIEKECKFDAKNSRAFSTQAKCLYSRFDLAGQLLECASCLDKMYPGSKNYQAFQPIANMFCNAGIQVNSVESLDANSDGSAQPDPYNILTTMTETELCERCNDHMSFLNNCRRMRNVQQQKKCICAEETDPNYNPENDFFFIWKECRRCQLISEGENGNEDDEIVSRVRITYCASTNEYDFGVVKDEAEALLEEQRKSWLMRSNPNVGPRILTTAVSLTSASKPTSVHKTYAPIRAPWRAPIESPQNVHSKSTRTNINYFTTTTKALTRIETASASPVSTSGYRNRSFDRSTMRGVAPTKISTRADFYFFTTGTSTRIETAPASPVSTSSNINKSFDRTTKSGVATTISTRANFYYSAARTKTVSASPASTSSNRNRSFDRTTKSGVTSTTISTRAEFYYSTTGTSTRIKTAAASPSAPRASKKQSSSINSIRTKANFWITNTPTPITVAASPSAPRASKKQSSSINSIRKNTYFLSTTDTPTRKKTVTASPGSTSSSDARTRNFAKYSRANKIYYSATNELTLVTATSAPPFSMS